MMLFAVHPLATTNAILNAVATVLLLVGWLLIKQKREIAHRNVMLAAFGASVLFLISYCAYHFGVLGAKPMHFQGYGAAKVVYLTILFSHIVLAATVPFLAGWTVYLGLADRRFRHRRLAQWTFPIWLYVSITGVVIYWMLYHLYPQPAGAPTIEPVASLKFALKHVV